MNCQCEVERLIGSQRQTLRCREDGSSLASPATQEGRSRLCGLNEVSHKVAAVVFNALNSLSGCRSSYLPAGRVVK